jgi:hypothetical protein
LCKIMLMRWNAGAVSAGGESGGAIGGKGKVPLAWERGVGDGRRLVGRRRAGCRRLRVGGLDVGGLGVSVEWISSCNRGLLRAMALHVSKFCGEIVAFQCFLDRAAEIHLWEPNRPWVRHPPGK